MQSSSTGDGSTSTTDPNAPDARPYCLPVRTARRRARALADGSAEQRRRSGRAAGSAVSAPRSATSSRRGRATPSRTMRRRRSRSRSRTQNLKFDVGVIPEGSATAPAHRPARSRARSCRSSRVTPSSTSGVETMSSVSRTESPKLAKERLREPPGPCSRVLASGTRSLCLRRAAGRAPGSPSRAGWVSPWPSGLRQSLCSAVRAPGGRPLARAHVVPVRAAARVARAVVVGGRGVVQNPAVGAHLVQQAD